MYVYDAANWRCIYLILVIKIQDGCEILTFGINRMYEVITRIELHVPL